MCEEAKDEVFVEDSWNARTYNIFLLCKRLSQEITNISTTFNISDGEEEHFYAINKGIYNLFNYYTKIGFLKLNEKEEDEE